MLNPAKADASKLKHMLTSYHNARDEAQKNGNKKAQWQIATYQEALRAASKIRVVDEVKLMREKQAILLLTSPG